MATPEALLLRGGELLDGSGAPARRADLLVEDGRIACIGDAVRAPHAHELDVRGLVVAPGFIDLHTHCDFTLMGHPRADSMVRQGVTTIVVGNCGHSPFPVGPGERRDQLQSYSSFLNRELDLSWSDAAGFKAVLSELPLALNVALQVGHGAVRIATMGFDAREPGARELERMRAAVADAMEAGAFGLSTGLIYPPGAYARTDEIVALADVAARYGGFYSTHLRDEGAGLLTAVEEAIQIAERAALPLQLSHHKVLGRANWGRTHASLELLDEARGRGLDAAADQYPYAASSTGLTALLPLWAVEGGTGAMQARLRQPDERARINCEVLDGPTDGSPKREFEPDTVLVASVPDADPALVGRTLGAIAAERGVEPVDLMLDLLGEHGGGVEIVRFIIGEDDIQRVMSHPQVAVASDGWILHPEVGGRPHPRSYGTFARVLGHYVREEGTLSLREAVRKMTSLPARRLGLADRGRLQEGMVADVAVFDPTTVADKATFLDPHQFCDGVVHVIANGMHVIDEGADTGALAGQVLEGPGRRS